MTRFRIIGAFFRHHKRSYIFGFVSMLVASYIQTLFPNLLGNTIDVMSEPGFAARAVWRNIGLILLIAVVTFGFTFLWRTLVIGNARKLECDIRSRLFRHFLQLSPSFYQHHKVGDLLAYAINDISAVRMTFGPALAMSVNSFVICVASIVTMLMTVDRRLTLLSLIPFPFVIWMMIVVGKQVRLSFLQVQESFATISGKVNEGIHGIRVIKAYVQEDPVLEDFRATSQGMAEASVRMVSIASLLGPVIEVCFSISFMLNLVLGGRMVLDGTITVGSFVAFNTYLAIIIAPVLSIGRIVNLFQRGVASMDRLNTIFDEKPHMTDLPHATTEPPRGSMSIRNLTFRYPGTEALALHIDNLEVPVGSSLGIIGPTGCGKSTLTSLLLRMYEAPPGTLFLDDRSITAYTLDTLRTSIAHVSQEPFLFTGTIRENITCFEDRYSEQSILNVIRDSCLEETLAEMPDGLNTMLGERGINLSGGQKQRIAIARALLRDAPLLILDDALSAVDTMTEGVILEHLKHHRKGRTTVIISHRVTSVSEADQILVLDAGEVIQIGTHDQLMREGGRYCAIYDEQETTRFRLIRSSEDEED